MAADPKWEGCPDRWPGRLQLIATHIPAGSAVLDIGAGAGGLEQLLPAGCRYTAVDGYPRPGQLRIDLDSPRARLPGGYDVAVLAGVLEHVRSPRLLFQHLARSGVPLVLLSYAWARPDTMRRAQLWRLIRQFGWQHTRLGSWKRQLVLRLDRP